MRLFRPGDAGVHVSNGAVDVAVIDQDAAELGVNIGTRRSRAAVDMGCKQSF